MLYAYYVYVYYNIMLQREYSYGLTHFTNIIL